MKRDWHTYFVKPQFAESNEIQWPVKTPAEISAHKENQLEGWGTNIVRLPSPIVAFSSNLTQIVDTTIFGGRVRIYPPFPIDRKGEAAGAFKEWWLPEGQHQVDKFIKFPSDAIAGLVTENTPSPGARYCQGLRIDALGSIDLHKIVQTLMEQVCQHTHQWWLRGRTSPFAGIRRLGCSLSRDFSFAELLRCHGAGDLESPWHAIIETQGLLGIEHVLSEPVWLRCISQATQGMRGDIGLLAFHDAISYYMDADDVLCIISMTICIEILGNKRRLLLGKKPTGFGELIKSSDLIDKSMGKVIQDLFIDRGHVAHGRRPPRSEGKADRVFAYLEAVSSVVSAYTSKLLATDWVKASQLEVVRGSA